MNNQHLNKVVLKNTTKMSLNDRFSAYRKNAESSVGAMRQRMQQVQQQTSKNWRLIQQMENRPSVIAALKLKKRSLKQRLGATMASSAPAAPRQSVKARLSLGSTNGAPRVHAGTLQRYRGGGYAGATTSSSGGGFVSGGGSYRTSNRRGAGRSRGGGRVGQIGRPLLQTYGGSAARGRGSQWSLNGAGAVAATATPLQNRLGTARGARSLALRRPRRGNRTVGEDNGEFRRGRASFRSPQARGRGQGNKFRSPNQSRGGIGNARRAGARARGRGRGRGRGARVQQPATSRQTLDNQLDEYMSRTKGHLDMELDSYMAQSQAE